MSLDHEQVRRVALLARIAVGDAEVIAMRDQLNQIFAMIEKMQGVDTGNIEPMTHSQALVLRLREDVVTEDDQHALFQAAAPLIENGFYLVPKVIE